MSMINVEASPLQAAREWRGVGLVVAARSAGLAVAQVEALEEGRIDDFETTEEMIATAVLYGASLGIGRDEAMALLDRTLSRQMERQALSTSVENELEHEDEEKEDSGTAPAGEPGAGTQAFSAAVQQRSAAISIEPMHAPAPHAHVQSPIIDTAATPAPTDLPERPAPAPAEPPERPIPDLAERFAPAAADRFASSPSAHAPSGIGADLDLGDLPVFELPGEREQRDLQAESQHEYDDTAVDAAADVDPRYREAWQHSQSELERWAAQQRETGARTTAGNGAFAIPGPVAAFAQRMGQGTDAVLERVLGRERTDRLADAQRRASDATRETLADMRARLDRSEHATLIVALGVGVMLIALLIGIASVLDGTPAGTDTKADRPAKQQAAKAAGAAGAAAAPGAQKPGGPTPMLSTSAIRVEILNAGRRKGYAHRMAGFLKAKGYRIGDVGNSRTRYGGAMILYPPKYRREAQRLSRQTGITTMDTIAASSGPNFTLVVT